MTEEIPKNGIVCAIDVNEYDQSVVDLAATYAAHFGVDLDLLHVTMIPDPATAAWPAWVGSPNLLIRDHERLQLVRTGVAGVHIRRHQLSGLPAQEILEFADARQPRLLVLGTHGRHGLARLLGSVANTVLRHANCPVMILRQLSKKKTPDDPATLENNP
jgi:universal stress protein A